VGTMLFIVGIVSPFVGKSPDSNPELTKQQKCLRQTVWLIYGSFVEQGKKRSYSQIMLVVIKFVYMISQEKTKNVYMYI
jgi:hypothetical protein